MPHDSLVKTIKTRDALKAFYNFGEVVQDSQGGFIAYNKDLENGALKAVARFIRDGDGNLVQEQDAPEGRQAPQGQYITGFDGRVYHAVGGRLTEVGNVGTKPEWMPVQDETTGRGRLFDPNTGQNIDLGQTSFAGIDPRDSEAQRQYESDRQFASQQAASAQGQAQEDRRIEMQERQAEAQMDLQNRQLGLQGANALTSLAESQEARRREILKGSTDFVYRAFMQRGGTPEGAQVTHADLINNLSGEFDKIANIYSTFLTPKPQAPLSSSGRLSQPMAEQYPQAQMQRPQMSPRPTMAPPASRLAPQALGPVVRNPDGSLVGGGGGYGGGGGSVSAPAAGADYSSDHAQHPFMSEQGDGQFSDFEMDTQPNSALWPRRPPRPGYRGAGYEPFDYGNLMGDVSGFKNLLTNPRTPLNLYKPGNSLKKLFGFEQGGALPPGEMGIVGEEGYEVIWTNPETGETEVIPNEIAKQFVQENGKVKKGSRLMPDRLPGYAEGTFFDGWNGQDAMGAINAVNASQASQLGQGGGGGWSGQDPYWSQGATSPLAGAGGAPVMAQRGDNFGRLTDATRHFFPGQVMQPRQPTGNSAIDSFAALRAALTKGNVTQDQLQADERRLRPPAVDALLKGTELPALRITANGANPAPQIASRIALNNMTPDELSALNTTLGVGYNSTLEDYLATSDQRFLAGQGERRLRTAYR